MGFATALYAFCAGMVYICGYLGISYKFFYKACWVGWMGLPAIFQFIYYVKEDNKSRKAFIIGTILYIFWGIVTVLCLTTNLIEVGADSLIPFHKHYGPWEYPARMVGGILLVYAIYKLFRTRNEVTGRKEAQLNYFLLGTIIYAVGGSLGAGFFTIFNGLMDPALVAYFSLPWVGLTFYAITRYRLFDVQIIISNSVSTLILTLLLGTINIFLFKILVPHVGSSWAILIALFVILLIFLRTPLRKVVQGGVYDVFLGDKYDYQAILKESTQAIITILDQDELLNYLIHAIQQSFKIHKACLFLKTPQDLFALRYDWGINKEIVTKFQTSEENIIEWMRSRKQIFIKEEQEELLSSEQFQQVYGNLGTIEAEVILPLFFKDNLIGFLTLGPKDDRRPYLQSDIDILQTLASQTAIAIENSHLYTEAITDGLTGLYHHKYFKMRLAEEIKRSKRYGHYIGLIMLDIDHFKSINDTYGHLTGDKILFGVAHLLKNLSRGIDIVARYGGEEFALLLPDTTKEGTMTVANRIFKAVRENSFQNNIPVTVSMGVASYNMKIHDLEADEFIERTDRSLYKAKENGRNRIEESPE